MVGTSTRYGPTDRVYVTMDATKVNTREDGWRDVKLGALYDQDLARKHYLACLQPARAFGRMLRRQAVAVGVWTGKEKIGAGDGADWVWKQMRINFPILHEHVLDFYHLSENIYAAAWQIYPEGSPAGHRWARHKMHMAKREGGRRLIRALGLSRKRDKRSKARQALRKLLGYLHKHRDRMDYPAMIARGIRIGTGPLESACKNVIGKRLKGSGMRWNVQNADAMAHLCALRASTGRWNAFWMSNAHAA